MSRKKMRGRKIRRRGPSVFHRNTRRKTILKNAALTILVLMIIPIGYFTTKFMMEDAKRPVSDSSGIVGSSTTAVQSGTAATATPTTAQPGSSDALGSLRAFYLPVARMADTASLDTTLNTATAAGFNAVLFDLKGADGLIRYASATPLAQQSKAISEDALTVDALKTIIQHLKDKGFAAIPRLYVFRDVYAPIHLPSARVMLKEYPTYTWLDNSKENGGKPWLNPYAPDAHRYIIELAKELADMGFSALMLDGVQFPNQTSQAYYGTFELTSLSHMDVLKKFVADLKTAVGDRCRVMHTMPGLSAFGDGTEPFGGNPVTFGADTVAPALMPATLGSKLKTSETTLSNPGASPYEAVKLAAGQVKLRLELMGASERPTAMPWLQAYDYSAEQIRQQVKAVTETLGHDASYIVYNADGNYDFNALKG